MTKLINIKELVGVEYFSDFSVNRVMLKNNLVATNTISNISVGSNLIAKVDVSNTIK
tara:strand:- start:456 stop:626 length:171 start_codon:yes stop_codon:yes gene_type:complete